VSSSPANGGECQKCVDDLEPDKTNGFVVVNDLEAIRFVCVGVVRDLGEGSTNGFEVVDDLRSTQND